MSVESMDTLLPSVPRTRTRTRKRRNTRRRARNTRTSTKGVLTWVNNGTQVMKMRNQRSKAWQPLPWHKGHLHYASSTTSPSPISSLSTPSSDIENIDEENETEDNIIMKFGKKGHKEIKKLLDKLEEKKEILHEQEDLLILEKERNLALEKSLAEEKAKVEKLTTDLSSANDSNKRMLKDYTLANESLASLKATHSELQSSLSCLKLTIVVFGKALKSLLRQYWTLVHPLAKVVLFVLTLI
jgi:hypothetical protein